MDSKKLIAMIEDTYREPMSYSGRGMYGERCVAVGCDSISDLLADFVESTFDKEFVAEVARSMSTDSLGLGVVAYWKTAPWLKE